MGWEVVVLIIVGGFLYRLKSIRIDFTGRDADDGEPKLPRQVEAADNRGGDLTRPPRGH